MKKIIIAFSLFIFSCSSTDESEDIFQGSEADLTDLFSEDVITILEELDFTINEGANPPNLEGTFFATPYILIESNRPSDNIGTRFYDQEYTFLNQNFEDNSIDFIGEQKSDRDGEVRSILNGEGSFISGDGNRFSIFLLVEQERIDSGSRSQTAFAISGEITTAGIVDFEQTLIMLDNFGNPFNEYIENGQGRRFVDDDGLSELITNSSTSKISLPPTTDTKLSTLESIL